MVQIAHKEIKMLAITRMLILLMMSVFFITGCASISGQDSISNTRKDPSVLASIYERCRDGRVVEQALGCGFPSPLSPPSVCVGCVTTTTHILAFNTRPHRPVVVCWDGLLHSLQCPPPRPIPSNLVEHSFFSNTVKTSYNLNKPLIIANIGKERISNNTDFFEHLQISLDLISDELRKRGRKISLSTDVSDRWVKITYAYSPIGRRKTVSVTLEVQILESTTGSPQTARLLLRSVHTSKPLSIKGDSGAEEYWYHIAKELGFIQFSTNNNSATKLSIKFKHDPFINELPSEAVPA